jgi:predicted nucleotidyltransferase
MKITKEIILQYLEEVKPELEEDGIEKIALFGSFATGRQNVYSDIDIAIKKKDDFLESRSAYDYFGLVSKIKEMVRISLHRNSDIFDLDSDSRFADTIKKEMIYV